MQKMKKIRKKLNSFTCTLIEEDNQNVKNEPNKPIEPERKPKPSKFKKPLKTTKSKEDKTSKNNNNKSNNNPNNSNINNNDKKQSKFYMKCAKKRQDKGLIMLPPNVESKIYRLKKSLQKKSLDPEEIRKIIRQKRRQEEIKLRKDQKHLCFKCRQPGHNISSCPLLNNNTNDNDGEPEPIDICYYCGSLEHKLSECLNYRQKSKQLSSSNNDNNNKTIELPYAKCFICQQKGHLTRNCPQNKNGAFPNGGKCRGCGSINHTLKECPENLKKQEEEEGISLKTYQDDRLGVDVDDYFDSIQAKTSLSSALKDKKIVKF